MGAVSPADRALLDGLQATLPDGWNVEIGEVNEEDEPELAWWALVCRRADHLNHPRLLINRSAKHVEVCLARKADNFWGSATRNTLADAVALVRERVCFGGNMAGLEAAKSKAGADVRH